jgi:pyruvate carboxylase
MKIEVNVKKLLIANRGEIAIRISRAANELGLTTAGSDTYHDRYSLHRYKTDESYQIGKEGESVHPYLDIYEIVNLAKKIGADSIHPGYGFLSENADFARICEENNIKFVGPNATVIQSLGNKLEAKKIAENAGIPTIRGEKVTTFSTAEKACKNIGFPVMLKAAAGGGGRGMRIIKNSEDLIAHFDSAKSESLSAFGSDEMFIEKYIANPKHIEIQILGDEHGNIVHLFERDCSLQRRFQKVVEFAPSVTLRSGIRDRLYQYALKIAKAVDYQNAGTVEFLVEEDDIYFIEVNPRIQVEHTVTELITGIDIVKAQLVIAQGELLSSPQIKIVDQSQITAKGFAIQCRITTENPQKDFKPEYGKIMDYRSASGFGIRLDEGNIYNGAVISPFFDSMLVKISSFARDFDTACERMDRALREFRIRGVNTNVQFLENVMNNDEFKKGLTTVHFLSTHPELFDYKIKEDRGAKLLQYMGDVIVNGNPDVKKSNPDKVFFKANVPEFDHYGDYPDGTKQLLNKLGADKFSRWLLEQTKVQITDTTFRDAHQSLLATRVRSIDMLNVAESYAKNHPGIFSMEMWGGATFDVAYRFLHEDPWKRLMDLRIAIPNICLQMLLRGSNAVGYTAYPDNLIEKFITTSSEKGIDIFRIFDSLNWAENMKLSIECVRERTGSVAEACICYTNNILDSKNTKYSLKYYVDLAKELKRMGAHIIGIKDMAGLLKPYAAEILIKELKDKIDLPIHLHTHDTASVQSATYLKAIESGVDAIDCALGGLSGLTSQPNLNSIVEMLENTPYALNMNILSLNKYSSYWENVREVYYPFESGLKAGAADVYYHEIPGGQYSNLKPQAISLGLGDRMDDIKQAYHDVNVLFGDIVKVTPTSKVVGDLALYLVSNGMTVGDIIKKGDNFPFPASVEDFFLGKLGKPSGGFPKGIQDQVLNGKSPLLKRAGVSLKPVDFENEFIDFKKNFGRYLTELDFISYKLYPKVFTDYLIMLEKYGDVSVLSSEIFFYGLKNREETIVEIAPGKTLSSRLINIGNIDEEGRRTISFEMNGQSRDVFVKDNLVQIETVNHIKADELNENHIGSPLPGLLSKLKIKEGDTVMKGDSLFIIEAMKMETSVTATKSGKITRILLDEGTIVDGNDLIMEIF